MALISATQWVVVGLTGAIGTSVAILAVAAIGALLLSGRVPLKRGVSVIVGCFILFSAAGIAEALTVGATSFGEPDVAEPVPIIEPPILPPAPPATYDPYTQAGVRNSNPDGHDLFQH